VLTLDVVFNIRIGKRSILALFGMLSIGRLRRSGLSRWEVKAYKIREDAADYHCAGNRLATRFGGSHPNTVKYSPELLEFGMDRNFEIVSVDI